MKTRKDIARKAAEEIDVARLLRTDQAGNKEMILTEVTAIINKHFPDNCPRCGGSFTEDGGRPQVCEKCFWDLTDFEELAQLVRSYRTKALD
jgi:ribosomal protein S27AE